MEKNKRVLLIIALALALVLGGAGLLYRQLSAGYTPEQLSLAAGEQVPAASSPAPEEGTEDSQTAPDFTVYDAEGNAVKLSDYFGRPIVLNFWASWCGPCRMIGPVIEELSEDYDGRADICKVNVDDEIDLAKRFRIMSIPCVILFKDGQEMNRLVGARDKEEYADAIDEIMG